MSLQDKIDNAKETPWMCYYRPKEQTIYMYEGPHKVVVACNPRSKWLCIHENDNGSVLLHRQNVTIGLTWAEFHKHWVRYEEKK